jgi:hypothetical protein
VKDDVLSGSQPGEFGWLCMAGKMGRICQILSNLQFLHPTNMAAAIELNKNGPTMSKLGTHAAHQTQTVAHFEAFI